MRLLTSKYKKRGRKLFLAIYTAFIIVGVFHYHPYSLDQVSTFSDRAPINRATDLAFDDFFSICSLHQFTQSIDNFHYSSSDIIESLTKLDSKINLPGIVDFTSLSYSKISLRAPPVNS